MRERTAWVVVLAPVVLLTLPGVFSGRAPLEGDLLVYQLPIYEVIASAARAAQFPWWDPTVQSSTPFFANPQTQLLWAPTWVHALLPVGSALMAWLLMHGLLAGSGALLWLRARGLAAAPAALGALVFTLGGPALSLVTKPDKLPAFALVPWLFWGLQAWAMGRRRRAFAVVVGAQVGMALSGGLEIWILALGGGVCLLTFEGEGWGRVRAVAALAATTVLAFALAGVQLIPFVSLMAHTTRSSGIDYAAVAQWSLVLSDLAEGVSTFGFQPDIVGSVDVGRVRFLGHVGAGAVALGALLAWSVPATDGRPRGPRGETVAIVVAGVGFLLLALGDATPVHRVAYELVPPLKSLRYPEKYLWGAWPFVALAAARGAARAWDEAVPAVVIVVGLGVGVSAVLLGAPLAHTAVGLLLASTILLGTAASPRRWWVVGLAALELVVLARVMLPPVDVAAVIARGEPREEPVPRYFNVDRHLDKRTPLPVRVSAQQRLIDVSDRAWPNVGVLRDEQGRRRFEYADGVRAIRLARQDVYFDNIAQQAIPNGALLLRRAGVSALGFLSAERHAAWTAVTRPDAPPFAPPHTVVDVPAFRRVGWARSARVFDDDAAVYRALGGDEDLLTNRMIAVQVGDPGVAAALAVERPAPDVAPPSVTVDRVRPDLFVVETAGVGGWIVVRDAWAPGWTAELAGSGRLLPLARADFYLQAVPIPLVERGETVRIRFSYRPSGLGAGLIISVLGLLSFLAALGVLGRGRRGARTVSKNFW
jgi:hypothetical protein